MPNAELNHLISMINQIARSIPPAASGDDDRTRAGRVADHIKRFWAKSMQQQIIAYARAADLANCAGQAGADAGARDEQLTSVSKAAILLLESE